MSYEYIYTVYIIQVSIIYQFLIMNFVFQNDW